MELLKKLVRLPFKEILSNKLVIKDFSQPINQKYQIPIKELFSIFYFDYEFHENDDQTITFNRNRKWIVYFILLNLLLNDLRNLFYAFMDSNDQMFRLYCGDLIQFADGQTTLISIAAAGYTCFATAIFLMCQYSPANQMKWLNIFNAIEGKQSFVRSKILMKKSAKKLIKLSLIFMSLSTASIYLLIISVLIIFFILPFPNLSIKPFLLYALPWCLINVIWVFYSWCYILLTMFITITCYYYKLRIHQLDVNAKRLIRKQLNHLNMRIEKLLKGYDDVIKEIDQFNKFASKLIFFIFLFLVSTDVFFIYNIIYVELNAITVYGHLIAISVFSFVSLLIFLIATIIPSQFLNNKRNLIKLINQKNIQIKIKIKVIDFLFFQIINFLFFQIINFLFF